MSHVLGPHTGSDIFRFAVFFYMNTLYNVSCSRPINNNNTCLANYIVLYNNFINTFDIFGNNLIHINIACVHGVYGNILY